MFPEKDAKLGPENVISSEFAQSIPPLERKKQTSEKKLIPEERVVMPDEEDCQQEDGKLIEIAINFFYLTKHYYLFSIQMFQEW